LSSVPFSLIGAVVGVLFVLFLVSRSFHSIGPNEIGLVTKKFSIKKLAEGQLIAFHGEAGYQAELLMPGLRIKLWPLFSVKPYPVVQVPPDSIGVVIAQIGKPLPQGAKSAEYKPEFGNFENVGYFMENGGQVGVQRPVLSPGTTARIHPIAFVVQTVNDLYGQVLSDNVSRVGGDELRVVTIEPEGNLDRVGIITTLEGFPLESGDIASRIGGFADVINMEAGGKTPTEIIEAILGNDNSLHNNYQNFQAFLEAGGKIGLQHSVLQYGRYLLNPFLVRVELVPMLVVNQGEVAVIKSYVGLPTADTSGVEFKFGSIVNPGHRGIWAEPLRTGKYPINPRIYAAELVPTSILTLNWSHATSDAHDLDKRLSPIDAKSKEAFNFSIDLQVQIHVPDTRAPKVISMVGTMQNLVNEVLQSAVGNYFRNKLQTLGATEFIQKRDDVQEQAQTYIEGYLRNYEVETRGVYIQDVVFPEDLVKVLTSREIAAQEKETFALQEQAQEARVALEQRKGVADMQGQLASANVSIEIKKADAEAAVASANGARQVLELTGAGEAAKIKSVGEATGEAEKAIGEGKAAGYEAQKQAIGAGQTGLVAALHEISAGKGITITPEILVGEGGSILSGLGAMLMGEMRNGKLVGAGAGELEAAPDESGPSAE
jgi:regulator of protease activity HflC (stomatin/prohibitin superfamily)